MDRTASLTQEFAKPLTIPSCLSQNALLTLLRAWTKVIQTVETETLAHEAQLVSVSKMHQICLETSARRSTITFTGA